MDANLQERLAAGSMDACDFPCGPPCGGACTGSAASATVRLNLGAGSRPLPGWTNLDRKTGQEVYPLDYPDGSVDEIRASHVLEHFSHGAIGSVLADWVRVLKPNGRLKVAVPNFQWIAQRYLAGEPINVQGYVMGGHVDQDDRHGAIFDGEELGRALRMAGLWDIRPWQSEIEDCAALPVSLNLMGRKKAPLPPLRISAAFSVPRLGFQDNFFSATTALIPLGIMPIKFDGAYWEQCLERVLTELVPQTDYVLCVDYDSAFTREQVEHLIRLAAEYPAADAIAPVQIRRGAETPLACREDAQGQLVGEIPLGEVETEELIPVTTAHFGLTLIRSAALATMPHPWLKSTPNANGEWGEGRQDADTYFWRQWREKGNTLFLAPHVIIAHGQFMLTWPGRRGMQPVYQHPTDFWTGGPPEEIWR